MSRLGLKRLGGSFSIGGFNMPVLLDLALALVVLAGALMLVTASVALIKALYETAPAKEDKDDQSKPSQPK